MAQVTNLSHMMGQDRRALGENQRLFCFVWFEQFVEELLIYKLYLLVKHKKISLKKIFG
jgi:hypothetical protein